MSTIHTRPSTAIFGPRHRSGPLLDSRDTPLMTCVERFERIQDAVGAGVDADRRQVTPTNDLRFVEDEQGAAVDALVLHVAAVRARDRALGLEVGEQREL